MVARHRGTIDNSCPPIKVRPSRLRHKENAEDVGLKGAAKLLLCDVGYVLVWMLLARVIDQDVNLAELFDRPGYGLGAKCLIADISSD